MRRPRKLSRRFGDLLDSEDFDDLDVLEDDDDDDDDEEFFNLCLSKPSSASSGIYSDGPLREFRQRVLIKNGQWLLHPDRFSRVQLGRYELIRCVGHGGMGAVFLGYDPELDRFVAVKMLEDELPEDHGDLRREARILAKLGHPNVIAVYDMGEHEGRPYLVMDFVQGLNAHRWLREESPSWRRILAVFIEVARGLSAAHDAGVVHNDLKPENVLVGFDGRVRVVDFGLAASAATKGQCGTWTYMAPESLAGRPRDARSDQFSFCVMLYEALYAQRPFHAKTAPAQYVAHCVGELQPGSTLYADLPKQVRALLVEGLAFDPEERHESMAALADALESFLVEPKPPRQVLIHVLGSLVLLVIGLSFSCERIERGHASFDEIASLAKKGVTVDRLTALSLEMARDGRGERALSTLNEAKGRAERISELRVVAKAADQVGLALYDAGEWEQSAISHLIARECHLESNNLAEEARSLELYLMSEKAAKSQF
ncbi:serine/threonine protein kinase [Pseudenhygromyxa sp. WMMC2535]|uniref:serine/threonine-protein kinase n=1 Tax=Pseudenhygromyxa sp. WMMC2535 TaxID=2712867 RepID=UPI001595306F|nr:serine/threonine-protein kinase [Pseudenhygromyxa sp. WMMC2535]NVB36455.1 serine/threonine protein kinase [Pseudenhygromyxa sp. WMMC2535]